MRRVLKKIRATLRRLWYRRGYYRTRVLPAKVPLYPLAYMPTGLTVHACGHPAIRIIDGLATADECALLLELATGASGNGTVVYGQEVQDHRLLPLICRCAALTGAVPQNVDTVRVRRMDAGAAAAPLDLPRDRTGTALIYLNDAGEDAGTVFSHADVTATPAAGRGICWINTDSQGRPRNELLPTDRAPTGNTPKWVAEIGFRPYPTLPVPALAPLQARPGVALDGSAVLPPGAWLPSNQ